MARYLIMSDIHGNLQALESAVSDVSRDAELNGRLAGAFLLGDIVDYGMQTNEVVEFMKHEFRERVGAEVVASIWGNHEHAVMEGDFSRFSSERGVQSAKYTASILTDETKAYLEGEMEHSGMQTLEIDGQKVLLVHGTLSDPYWGKLLPEDVHDDPSGQFSYDRFDIVMSGHTHCSQVFTKFYPSDDETMRGKKAVTFINPGSVGQPRNHNPLVQYAIWDSETGEVGLHAVEYDIEKTMSYYHGQVDDFYRDRLRYGV